jgi:hypothetical protein
MTLASQFDDKPRAISSLMLSQEPVAARLNEPVMAGPKEPVTIRLNEPVTARLKTPVTARLKEPVTARLKEPVTAQLKIPSWLGISPGHLIHTPRFGRSRRPPAITIRHTPSGPGHYEAVYR